MLISGIIFHDMEPNEEKYEMRGVGESVTNYCSKFFFSFLTFDRSGNKVNFHFDSAIHIAFDLRKTPYYPKDDRKLLTL